MRKMKIALIYDAIYPYIKGGGEKRYFETGKGLTAKGHEVHFYGMKFWEGKKVIKRDGMYYHGICRPRSLYSKNGKRSIKEAVYFGVQCLQLIKEDFDVIDCCNFPYFSMFSCKLVTIIKRKQLFSTWHEVWGKDYWYDYIGWKGLVGYIIEKLASLMPSKIISVSGLTTKMLKEKLKSKKAIYTIPNGIKIELINSVPIAENKSDIIFAGRLALHKNIDILIKTVKLVKKEKDDVKAFIIGDGPEKEKLEELSKKLNLRDNIKFFGFLEDHNKMYSLVKSSKVFILPSVREGFGMVVIEANACGIPVITINHKDNAARELIMEGENGYTCFLDEQEIAHRVLKVINKEIDVQTKNNCIDLVKKYDWIKLIDRIEDVYYDIGNNE